MIVRLKISRALESLSLLIWILCIVTILGHCMAVINSNFSCIAKERQALLSLKEGLIDDGNVLSSWNSEDFDCCNWVGIRCSKRNGHIISLDIGPRVTCKNIKTCYAQIRGEIGPSLHNLTHLNYLDLSYNNFTKIPEFLGSLNRMRYLNISQNYYLTVVPQHLGNLTALKFLDLSENSDLKVETLEWVSPLSSLEYLNMNHVNLSTTRYCFQSITKLPLLRKLYLENSYVSFPWSLKDFNSSKFLQEIHIYGGNLSSPAFYEWLNTSYSELIDLQLVDAELHGPPPDFLRNMISITHLDLSWNELRGPIPNSLGDMSSLEHLDLSHNNLGGPLPDFLRNMNSLTLLDLSSNELRGPIPNLLGDMISLEYLDLSANELRGPIPNLLGNMISLEYLDLSANELRGEIPKSFKQLCKLRTLHLSSNKLNGCLDFFDSMTGCSLPDLSSLPSLEVLAISTNNFTGRLKESIFWKLSNLTLLDISSNYLEGVISDGHISKLSKLKILSLRNNSFTLKFRDDWVPPFQLTNLLLGACKFSDPHFPNWLRTQGSLWKLDISDSGISDTVPTWFRNISTKLGLLNLSSNNIRGLAPNCSFCRVYDLSNNRFHGPLPQFSSDIWILNLSQNKFSGSTSSLCNQEFEWLWSLDLSDNQFSDNLTECWMSFRSLHLLNLEHNNFTGELPSSLKNCTSLKFLNLEQNQIYGEIPAWIGERLTQLMFLGLKSNKFWGSIPSNLCHLQSIKILDISMNSISGTIPSCLNNFTALTVEGSTIMSSLTLFYSSTDAIQLPIIDPFWVMWKGKMVEYPIQIVGLLNYIDLSSNKLSGEIPEGLTSLSRLGSLNLSRNNLTGTIPENIGHLRHLDSLDLSDNHLSGTIPESITDLSFLGILDLSNNNLSGPIPTGNHLQTFAESAFVGNQQLCGLPLKVECPVHVSPGEGTTGNSSSRVNHEQLYENTGICVSVVLGFLVGFHGVCGPLLYSASWRTANYQFLNKIKDGLWVFIVVNIAKLKRQFQQWK